MLNKNFVIKACLLIVGLQLTACANLEKTTPAGSVSNLEALTAWSITGKVGITSADERINANLDWQQMAEQYHIALSGPFGQGRTQIDGGADTVVITTPEQTFSGVSPEQLMQQTLGWSVPVRHFKYWIKGLPAPDAPVAEQSQNPDGTLHTLTQDNWQVSIDRYQQALGLSLPEKLSARTGNIKLLLVIRSWQAN